MTDVAKELAERYFRERARRIFTEGVIATQSNEQEHLAALIASALQPQTGSNHPENVCKFHGSDNQTEECTVCFCEGKWSVAPPWIGIGERLPDNRREVWVAFDMGEGERGVREANCQSGTWYFNTEDGEIPMMQYLFKVTHWTEINLPPAPPTEQNERAEKAGI